MDRRRFLTGTVGISTLAIAGCLGDSNVPGDAVEDLPHPALGPDDAPVEVEVWEDFSCPHCASFDVQVFPDLVENYVDPGHIRYVFYDFPIPVDDRWSWDVAEAGRVVQDKASEDAFWTFKATMFANQSAYSKDFLAGVAEDLGLDGDDLVTDVNDDRYRPVVENAKQIGSDNGVQGTPTVFVEGTVVDFSSAPSRYDAVAEAIDSHL